MKAKTILFILLSLIYLVLSGACGGDSVGVIPEDERTTTEPSLADPETATGLSFGLVSFMEYDSLNYKVWQDNAPLFDATAGCFIESTETAQVDQKCVIDVSEEDLHFHGINLEAVVPPGVCDYVSIHGPWFYNYEAGRGPTQMNFEIDTDDEGLVIGARCSVNGLAVDADYCDGTLASDEIRNNVFDTSTRSAVCQYDYSDNDGPNCCSGTYLKVIRTLDIITVGATPVVVATPDVDWGGIDRECYHGGAYLNDMFGETEQGTPTGFIQYTLEDGLADRIEIDGSVFREIYGTNTELANWHANVEECNGVNNTSCDDRHHHQDSGGGNDNYDPIFISPLEDRTGDTLFSTNDSWTLNCLDQNLEVKHRIRLYVREYDVVGDFENFLANPVNGTQAADTTAANRIGAEGTDCPGFSGEPCNDRVDLDDYAPTANPSLQSPTGYTNCPGWGCFPQVDLTD